MKTVGRWFAAAALASVFAAAAWSGPAAATGTRKGVPVEPVEPAVVAGGRTMGAEELARAGRALESAPAVTIYQARLADGTLELSDRPPAGATGPVERRSYGLAPQDAATRQRAEAEREYWRKQADAFARRQQERERDAERAARERASRTVLVAEWPRRAVVHQGWPTPLVAYPAAPVAGYAVPGVYGSSPGALQGRSGGFIGSGFSTAR
jgi:hypothetical protein